MRIVSRKRLLAWCEERPDAKRALLAWETVTLAADWLNFVDLRADVSSADQFGHCVIINIRRNDYRLIVHVDYKVHLVYLRHLLTHAEYDRERWKDDC